MIYLGLDVGSTTTKYVAIDAATGGVVARDYRRHGAQQARSVARALSAVSRSFPGAHIRMAICGSGASGIAEALGVPYIQEVVAGAVAVRALHPRARCAIELGGQDAKMVFFRENEATGTLEVADMRMNGSCAGGTGAFIDEVASVLGITTERFEEFASRGAHVYDISGRCGVYAKTDIQPLLNQGVSKEDLALSALHAIAKQTIGGLAQGLDIEPPVVFEGGPLTFNPTLVDVFAQRLGLSPEQTLRPKHPETMMAYGAALSLGELFADEPADVEWPQAKELLENASFDDEHAEARPFFESEADKAEFLARHARSGAARIEPEPGRVYDVYLGIDSGSTTTKFALIDADENLVDSFYARNDGAPLSVARDALVAMRRRYENAGARLNVLSCGTTGYGELLFERAFHADFHTVETVAHAAAAAKYAPDASFILDIGGQDMKAVWLADGVIGDIVVNEACSSGCGSFLENFAGTLGMKADEIAEAAFRSKEPAALGSRCTVFMNSSIVSEQRRGKTPDDIMAGLCRSIVENVFTKVVRVANLDSLGPKVVVQGGTFENDAVLRALEQYLGRDVVRAPYPGLMGAIGVALLAKRDSAARKAGAADGEAAPAGFIGLDALEGFSFTQNSDAPCPFCGNHCARTLVSFSDGSTFVTGNRCPKGEVVGDARDAAVRAAVRKAAERARDAAAPNLYELRERLLLQERPFQALCGPRGVTIGIPRVLRFWDDLPFWTTFWKSLGFDVAVSRASTRAMYEEGLASVPSDTECFPAKLVHGHIRELARAGVDRIFMPSITATPSENAAKTSESMCALVKGYPIVIRNSDDPRRRFGVPFDAPLFHWHSDRDRSRQLAEWMKRTFDVDESLTRRAVEQADAAQEAFRSTLLAHGREAIGSARARGGFAVVLAGRPYHNDPLVNHDLPRMFAEMGIPVLPPDAVPHATEVDLSRSRIDIVNNYHARVLSCAVLAASDPALEFAQIVSFGCGHDAYLSDEAARLMREISGETPLVLKVDESDATGPLRIRVHSFVETLRMRRAEKAAERDEQAARANQAGGPRSAADAPRELSDPYPQKYVRADRREKVVLIPNTSHAFCRLMTSAFRTQGIRCEPLPIGRERAIALGKKYVHNDICFPAQIVIGEALAALESGAYDECDVAIGTGKYVGDCRLTHYAALLRKALDDAGYGHVPIITNDTVDAHDMQPGFSMNLLTSVRIAFCLPMIDALEQLLRSMRPYETEPGAADAAFDEAIDLVMDGLEAHGVRGATQGFRRAIDRMRQVPYDRGVLRPQVLIVGEYLLNFHPGANRDIERYLERCGMEVIEARMTDVIRKTYFYQDAQVKEYHVSKPANEAAFNDLANRLFDAAHANCDRIARAHPLYEPPVPMGKLVQTSDPIMHHTFDAGEGVLIPAEILHHASRGCRAFVILQPFGCLPNHVCGRGVAKRLKEAYPDAQILPLDYDPDVSFANIENRLQMLVMNARLAQADTAYARATDATREESDGQTEEMRAGGNSAATPNRGVLDAFGRPPAA